MSAERLPAWQADRLALLLDATGGISLGARERASLTWLAGFESDTVQNVAAVMGRLTKRAEVLNRRATAAIDDARSRHLEADRYRGQLNDLCDWAGIDPDDVADPYEALLARLRDREQSAGLASQEARDEVNSLADLCKQAGVASEADDAPAAALLAETCPDCERVGQYVPVPGRPGRVECRVCSATWEQSPARPVQADDTLRNAFAARCADIAAEPIPEPGEGDRP